MMVAIPVGNRARNNTPPRARGLIAAGSPSTYRASGNSTTAAQINPAAAKDRVLTGGHRRVMMDPQA